MKDQICEPNPKVAVSCQPPLRLWQHRSMEKFQSRPKMASTTSQCEISRRIYVMYFFVLHRWAKLAEHCAMEPDYFGSFKQSWWLSIFVVHEIKLRLRCIMESVNGSLSVTFQVMALRSFHCMVLLLPGILFRCENIMSPATTTIAGLYAGKPAKLTRVQLHRHVGIKGLRWWLLPMPYVLMSEQYPRQYQRLYRR